MLKIRRCRCARPLPVLLVHGTVDQVVPFRSMEQAETYLGISSVPYTAHAIDGIRPWH